MDPDAPFARYVSAVRIVALGTAAIRLASTPATYLQLAPAESIQPYGVGRLLLDGVDGPGLLGSEWVPLGALQLLGLLMLALAMFARGRRVPAIVAFACVFVMDTFDKAVGGYASHAGLLVLYVVGLSAVLPAPRWWTPLDVLRGRSDGPWHETDVSRARAFLHLTLLITALSYAYVAIFRLWNVSPGQWATSSFATQTVRYGCMTNPSATCEAFVNAAAAHGSWLVSTGFALATLLELTGGFALGQARSRAAWCLAMIGLHVFAAAAMNIWFMENTLLLAALSMAPAHHATVGAGGASAGAGSPGHPALAAVLARTTALDGHERR